MEKNEKTQVVPAWVKIIGDFAAPVQQPLGNMCAGVVQNLCTIALVSAELFISVVKEVVVNMHPEIDADLFVKSLVGDCVNVESNE